MHPKNIPQKLSKPIELGIRLSLRRARLNKLNINDIYLK